MRKKGHNAVIPTAIIIFVSVSLVAGWSWHSVPGYEIEPGNHIVERAFYDQQSDLMVEVTGQVSRIMVDHNQGADILRFQMRTPTGQYIMVTHNNNRSDPVPVSPKDQVIVRGRYEWTELGGNIRMTHRDNSLKRRHGWIEHEGKRYD